MGKRLIDMTPCEMEHLEKEAFLQGIRASEGRVVCTYVSPAAPNLIENVSNIEMCGAFGADIINFQGYNPEKLIMPGLPSKDLTKDEMYDHLQFKIGDGYSVQELKKICGRPLGATLQVPDRWGDAVTGLNKYAAYSKEYFEFLLKQGYDFFVLAGLTKKTMVQAVREARTIAGDNVVIEAGTPHGPGNPDCHETPYILRDVVTVDYVKQLAEVGADIIDIPAISVTPSFTSEYVKKLIDTIHEEKKLAAVVIAHSIEGTSQTAIERIALDNKTAGADMFNLAAAGYYESMPVPETLQALCIAVKGRRYTYRRMAQSILR